MFITIKKIQKTVLKTAGLLLVAVILLWILAELFIKPPLVDIAEKKVNNILLGAVYDGVRRSCDELGYNNNLVRLEQDAQGRIVFVQSDSIYIGRLAGQISGYINEAIEQKLPLAVELPAGVLTGSSLMAAYGPSIKIELVAAAAQQVEIRSEFAAAGINQTRHIIYLHANLSSRLELPMQEQTFQTEVKVPLSEYIIIGSVPDTYVDFKMPAQ